MTALKQLATELSSLANALKTEQSKAEQSLAQRQALFTELKEGLFPKLDLALAQGKEALAKTASKLNRPTFSTGVFYKFRPATFSTGIVAHFHTKGSK